MNLASDTTIRGGDHLWNAARSTLRKLDLLGFEFEMGLFPNVLDEARSKGIDIAPKYIPAEVFDKRAVDREPSGVSMMCPSLRSSHYVTTRERRAHRLGTVAVELTDFSVFYYAGQYCSRRRKQLSRKKAGSQNRGRTGGRL